MVKDQANTIHKESEGDRKQEIHLDLLEERRVALQLWQLLLEVGVDILVLLVHGGEVGVEAGAEGGATLRVPPHEGTLLPHGVIAAAVLALHA